MLTLRAPSWPRRKTSPAAKENRSESDDPKSKTQGKKLSPQSPAPAAAPEPVPNGRFGANRRLRKRRSGSLSPMKADGTPRPSSQDLTRPASAPDLASPAPAPAAETTPTRPPSKFDSGNFSFHKSPEPEAPPPSPPPPQEYVRREELVAAAREVGWEPFSCEEIRAVTLER